MQPLSSSQLFDTFKQVEDTPNFEPEIKMSTSQRKRGRKPIYAAEEYHAKKLETSRIWNQNRRHEQQEFMNKISPTQAAILDMLSNRVITNEELLQ
jgi:putative protein kinase ArgK-like GTPase of G3E family